MNNEIKAAMFETKRTPKSMWKITWNLKPIFLKCMPPCKIDHKKSVQRSIRHACYFKKQLTPFRGIIIPCAILLRSPTSVGLVHETVLLTHIKIKEQQNLRKTESQWHSRDKVMLNKDYCPPLFLDSSFYEDVGCSGTIYNVCIPTAWLVKGDDHMPFIIATFSRTLIC